MGFLGLKKLDLKTVHLKSSQHVRDIQKLKPLNNLPSPTNFTVLKGQYDVSMFHAWKVPSSPLPNPP